MNKDEWKIEELDVVICRLAANLLRIMAGAGRVADLGNQLQEAHTLANEVAQRGWSYADNAMQNALQIRWPYIEKASTESEKAFNSEEWAKADIVRDALRLAAARLLNDGPNLSKNDSELHSSIRQYNEAAKAYREASDRAIRKRRPSGA